MSRIEDKNEFIGFLLDLAKEMNGYCKKNNKKTCKQLSENLRSREASCDVGSHLPIIGAVRRKGAKRKMETKTNKYVGCVTYLIANLVLNYTIHELGFYTKNVIINLFASIIYPWNKNNSIKSTTLLLVGYCLGLTY